MHYWTIEDYSELKGVCRWTIYRHIKSGKIIAKPMYGKILIPEIDQNKKWHKGQDSGRPIKKKNS